MALSISEITDEFSFTTFLFTVFFEQSNGYLIT